LSIVEFVLKAYIEQLESSRAKLAHLEQELQRARQQVNSCDFGNEVKWNHHSAVQLS
jgi:hypothetical protein